MSLLLSRSWKASCSGSCRDQRGVDSRPMRAPHRGNQTAGDAIHTSQSADARDDTLRRAKKMVPDGIHSLLCPFSLSRTENRSPTPTGSTAMAERLCGDSDGQGPRCRVPRWSVRPLGPCATHRQGTNKREGERKKLMFQDLWTTCILFVKCVTQRGNKSEDVARTD